MPDHVRKQIRDQVVSVVTGLATTGSSVFASRRYPFQKHELPAIAVYAVSEDSDAENISSARHLERTAEIIIEGVAQDNDALDDTLDAMAKEIETAIGAAVTNKASSLRGLVRDMVLINSQMALQPDKTAEIKTGSIVLTYRVPYRTRLADPTTIN